MKALADAGIYLALDVNSPAYSLNRENPDFIHASYNDVGSSFVSKRLLLKSTSIGLSSKRFRYR
jgi:hypothetical protein